METGERAVTPSPVSVSAPEHAPLSLDFQGKNGDISVMFG
jgi:hypothetical protein